MVDSYHWAYIKSASGTSHLVSKVNDVWVCNAVPTWSDRYQNMILTKRGPAVGDYNVESGMVQYTGNHGVTWPTIGDNSVVTDGEPPFWLMGQDDRWVALSESLTAYDSADAGATWGAGRTFGDVWPDHLFADEQGYLHAAERKRVESVWQWLYYRSEDWGATWTTATQIPGTAGTGMYIWGLVARGGHVFALGVSSTNGVYILYSHDNGDTWGSPVEIRDTITYGEDACFCLSESTLYVFQAHRYYGDYTGGVDEWRSTDWDGAGAPTFSLVNEFESADVPGAYWADGQQYRLSNYIGCSTNWVGGDDRTLIVTGRDSIVTATRNMHAFSLEKDGSIAFVADLYSGTSNEELKTHNHVTMSDAATPGCCYLLGCLFRAVTP